MAVSVAIFVIISYLFTSEVSKLTLRNIVICFFAWS